MRSVAVCRRAAEVACLVVSAFFCVQVASAEPQSGAPADASPIWVADRTFETGEEVKEGTSTDSGAPSPTQESAPRSWEDILGPAPSEAPQSPPSEPSQPTIPIRQNPTVLTPTRADGLVYPVSTFVIEYAEQHPDHPPIEELLELEVKLTPSETGYVAPRLGFPRESIRIGRPADSPPVPFYGSAIRAVGAAIVEEYNRRGLVGALVIPHQEDVDSRSSRDLRPPDRTALRLVVWTGHLAEQRTFASGSRYPENERVDNPAHASIKERSPVQPGDLLDKAALDEYVARLNRYPGRNVDVAITRASQPGNVYLDYLIAENPRRFNAYVQVSDTGTEGTSDWRQRFGIGSTQLTGHDDLLQVDYITSGFDSLNAVFGSYEIPLGFVSREIDRLRVRGQGSWSEFDASEIGSQSANFKGDQWHAGGQLILNVYQVGDWFFDAYTGARYQHVTNESEPLPGFPKQEGTVDFFFPELGARVEHHTRNLTFLAGISGEMNLSDVAGTNSSDIDNEQFSRTNVHEVDFQILRWEASTSFFLQPLFEKLDMSPASVRPTRATELFFSASGQYTNDRLIPYLQGIAGGLNTVRGYPQSKAAADIAALWRAEFRLHLPRLLDVRPDPIELPLLGSFYPAPPRPYGQPDWDLIVRPFVDAALMYNNDNEGVPGEQGQVDLLGAGVGLELQLYNNVIIRGDWGRAQTRAYDTRVGHDSFHFSFTFVM